MQDRRRWGTLVADAIVSAVVPPDDSVAFGAQRGYINEQSVRCAAVCSRRAGKSEGNAIKLVNGAIQRPGSLSLYVGLTLPSAVETIKDKITRAIARAHMVGTWTIQHGQVMCRMSNGSRIWVAGCHNKSECEKFRGADRGFGRVIIDEAQSFGAWLEYLVDDVIEPALLDSGGDISLSGTPNARCSGYFYQITTGAQGTRQWPTHRWTVLDNPYIVPRGHSSVAGWLAAYRESKGWDVNHPTYQREWLGQWIRDDQSLVYPFDWERNTYVELPEDRRYLAVTGVDIGYIDATAWTTALVATGYPEIWVPRSQARKGVIPSAMAARTGLWLEGLAKDGWTVTRTVVDEGGAGKGYAEEARTRYAIPVTPAVKTDRKMAIEFLRGDILNGNLLIHPKHNAELIEELTRLEWDDDHEDVRDGQDDHLSDALLYAHREARTLYSPRVDAPDVDEARREKARRAAAAAKHRARSSLRLPG